MKILLIALITFSLNCHSSDTKKVVEKIFSWAKSDSVSTNKKIQSNINSMIDFDFLSERILGSHIQKISKKDVSWFKGTLERMLSSSLFPRSSEYLNKTAIKYTGVVTKGNNSTVSSIIHYKDEEIEVDYQLVKKKKWRLIDIVIDGDSWSEDIREQVQDTLAEESWSKFKERINKRSEK